MLYGRTQNQLEGLHFCEVQHSVVSSTGESLKDETRLASDTAHFCVHPYNICDEASAHLYGEERSF